MTRIESRRTLRLLVVARWVCEDSQLDLGGVPAAAEARGHEVSIMSVDQMIASPACEIVASEDFDVLICRFSSDPLADIVLRSIEQSGVPIVGAGNGITYGDDQEITLHRLRSAGIPTPKSVVIRRCEDAAGAVMTVGLPAVTKDPLTMGGSGVRLAYSADEVAAMLLQTPSRRLIVQHFHDEVNNGDVRLFVVDGRVVESIRRNSSSKNEFRANRGLGGIIEQYEPTVREKSVAVAASKQMLLDVTGIDILPTSRGPAISEVNHNPGAIGMPRVSNAIIRLAEASAVVPVRGSR